MAGPEPQPMRHEGALKEADLDLPLPLPLLIGRKAALVVD